MGFFLSVAVDKQACYSQSSLYFADREEVCSAPPLLASFTLEAAVNPGRVLLEVS